MTDDDLGRSNAGQRTCLGQKLVQGLLAGFLSVVQLSGASARLLLSCFRLSTRVVKGLVDVASTAVSTDCISVQIDHSTRMNLRKKGNPAA